MAPMTQPAEMQAKAFEHDSKVADTEPNWGDVDKTALPAIAHAIVGDPELKSTWGYPHHWISGAGGKDDAGVWTTGTMYLHRGGLNAAWAAAHGARSGQEAPQEVLDHLQVHRRTLGLEDEEGRSFGIRKSFNRGKLLYKARRVSVVPEAGLRSLPMGYGPKAKEDPGYIQGWASVFNTVDLVGDVIRPGAFAKTLHRVRQGKVPLMARHASHGNDSLDAIGLIEDAQETDYGLFIHAPLDTSELAQTVRERVLSRLATSLSIGYLPTVTELITMGDQTIMEVKELKLLEVTVTAFPINELADITDSKSFNTVATKLCGYVKRLGERLGTETSAEEAERLLNESLGGKDVLAALAVELGKLAARVGDLSADVKPGTQPVGKDLSGHDLSLIQSEIDEAELWVNQLSLEVSNG